jgi:glutathione S-transferase
MTESKIKLSYFAGRGLAEISRILLAQAGVKYEDIRLSQDEWKAKKESTTFGQMPLLEVDGKVLAQSAAINRFIAREHGLYGANNWEAAQIDSVMDALTDATKNFHVARNLKDEKEKASAFTKYFAEDWPVWAKRLTTVLAKNHEGKGFFVGDKVSIADVYIYYSLTYLVAANKDALNDFALLAAHSKRVTEVDRIATWIATRPKSEW